MPNQPIHSYSTTLKFQIKLEDMGFRACDIAMEITGPKFSEGAECQDPQRQQRYYSECPEERVTHV